MIENDWRRRNAIKVEYLHNQRTGVPMETEDPKRVEARRRLEDIALAKELGIPVEELTK